jgi:DNA-binding CsgD family transcriptional regulator
LDVRLHILKFAMLDANAALDLAGSIPIGVVVVSSNRQVLSLNRRAKEITDRGDALLIQNNVLCGVRSSQSSKLDQLIAGVMKPDNGSEPMRAMAIFRDTSDWPLSILVVPSGPDCAAVLIGDPELKALPNCQVLGELFRFTPTECRLASLLMRGVSLGEAASELNVSLHTARTHLKVIFQKTGANRQGHLMYLLLSSPASISLDAMQAAAAKATASNSSNIPLSKSSNKGKK